MAEIVNSSSIPSSLFVGELELPFMALLLVIVAPHQVLTLRQVGFLCENIRNYCLFLTCFHALANFFPSYRGTQQGAIISLVIAGYLAFQHFSRAGNLRKAFEQGSVVATLAIICITAVSCLFLI